MEPLSAVTTELEAARIHPLQHEVTKLLSRLHQVLPAQELLTVRPLHLPAEVMHKHMRLRVPALLAPRQDPCREYRRHPAWPVGPLLAGPVHENDVPVHLVGMIGEIVDRQLTLGEQEILHGPALVTHLLPCGGHELLHLAHLGRVLDVVGVDLGMLLLDVCGVVAVLVDEDGPAVVVEGFPEEGLVSEAKY